MTQSHPLGRAFEAASDKLAKRDLMPEYRPELAEPVIYRDQHGTEHAALITRVIDDYTVHLVVFPDQGHHHHVTATAIDTRKPRAQGDPPGWFPNDA